MFHHHFATHVFESALTASHVEVARIRREVLRVYIEFHVAAGRDHVSFRVVLRVVGAQPKVLVMDVDFAVGEK